MPVIRNSATMATIVLALGLTLSGCGNSADSGSKETTNAATTAGTSPAAVPKSSADLQSLLPQPQDLKSSKGPDTLADNGIHMHYQVNGTPVEVMGAYKRALTDKGWLVTTIVTSGSGSGGGGATYTGTHGDAYGVFDGGGYESNTFIDVCVWPTKPTDPNCSRGDR